MEPSFGKKRSVDGYSKMDDQRRLILIVDDSKDDREMYEYSLSRKGFRVASAGDGEDGLTKAFELCPDLVIMDLSLPLMSGLDATRRLKSDARTKHIPIIILTAHASDGATTVIKAGCEGFLIKPCLPDDMFKEVVRVLDRNAPAREGDGIASADA